MKTCSNCSVALDTDSVFCTSCGTPIIQTIHCPKCGGTINADVKFCKYCAFDLSQPIQTAATATSPLPPLETINPQTSDLLPQVKPIKSLQTNATSVQAKTAPDNPASLISPSGAALVVICFFLPWLQWSACGIRKTASGADLAQFDGSFWLFPLMGIVSVLAYFIAKGQKQIWTARPFILISSIFALSLMFYKVNSIPTSTEILGQRISAADLGFQVQFGGYGTIIGFILAIIGCAFMTRKITALSSAPQNSNSLPLKFESTSGSLKPNTAATLCYVSPLVLPQVITLFVVMLFPNGRNALIFLLLISTILSISIVQIFLLKNESFNRYLLVRFHAFQSIFLALPYLCAVWLLYSLGYASPFTILMYLIGNSLSILDLGLFVGYLILTVFIAVKANKMEMYKLPVIGDWAMNRANKNSPLVQTVPPSQTFDTPILTEVNYSPPTNEPTSFTPISSTINVEDSIKDSSQNETEPSNFSSSESAQTEALDRRTLYGVGGSLLGLILLIGIITWATSSSGNQTDSSSNVNVNVNLATRIPTTSSNVNRSSSNITTDTSDSSNNMSSASSGRTGRLTTNLNLRSAPNKTALSVGIHFQNARVKILDGESYDTADGYSTWYKVKVIEYGCDSEGNLGCGKNSDNDADEGWLNSKYVILD